eukprot:g1703.t1
MALSGNIGPLIDSATSDLQIHPNWEINLQIVDNVNATRNLSKLRAVSKIIRKKLSAKQIKTVMLSLILIECLVKNCKSHFHEVLSDDEKFQNQMKKLCLHRIQRAKNDVGGRETPTDVQNKAISLTQAWGEAFLPHSNERRGRNFVHTYHELRRQGVAFPRQYDQKNCPIFTPSSTAHSSSNVGGKGKEKNNSSSSTSNFSIRHSAQVHENRKSLGPDFGIIDNVMLMLAEMLSATSSKEDCVQNELISEMLSQCQSFQGNLQAAIQQAMERGHSEKLPIMLEMNDDLISLLREHDWVSKNGPRPKKREMKEEKEIDILPPSLPSLKTTTTMDTLNDLNNFFSATSVSDKKDEHENDTDTEDSEGESEEDNENGNEYSISSPTIPSLTPPPKKVKKRRRDRKNPNKSKEEKSTVENELEDLFGDVSLSAPILGQQTSLFGADFDELATRDKNIVDDDETPTMSPLVMTAKHTELRKKIQSKLNTKNSQIENSDNPFDLF